jgi:hypothetical protein
MTKGTAIFHGISGLPASGVATFHVGRRQVPCDRNATVRALVALFPPSEYPKGPVDKVRVRYIVDDQGLLQSIAPAE